MKKFFTFVLLAAAIHTFLIAPSTVNAQELVQKDKMIGGDGFTWYKMKYQDGDVVLWGASNANGKMLTPFVKGNVHYRKGGFFEITEKMEGSQLFVHWLYNTDGVCVLPKSLSMNVIKIDLEDGMIICWRYDNNYITIPGSEETYSLDGSYFAKGDWTANKKGFEENQRPVSNKRTETVTQMTGNKVAPRNTTVEVAKSVRPANETVAPETETPKVEAKQPVVEETANTNKPTVSVKPVNTVGAPAPAAPAATDKNVTPSNAERPLFEATYVSSTGYNPENGLRVPVDENLKINIAIYGDRLVENGFEARYVGTDKDAKVYCGGFVGMTVTYYVDSKHEITKHVSQVGPAGVYKYEYTLSVK